MKAAAVLFPSVCQNRAGEKLRADRSVNKHSIAQQTQTKKNTFTWCSADTKRL